VATITTTAALPTSPIGTILDYAGAKYGLGLPEGYVYCNGAAINEPRSILHGQSAPDLRLHVTAQSNTPGAAHTAEGATSLTLTTNNIPAHTHSCNPPNTTSTGNSVGHTHQTKDRYIDQIDRETGEGAYSGYVSTSSANEGYSSVLALEIGGYEADEGIRVRTSNTDATSGNSSQAHTHNVNIAAFNTSAQTTTGTSFDKRQLTYYCDKIMRIF